MEEIIENAIRMLLEKCEAAHSIRSRDKTQVVIQLKDTWYKITV
jgi:hypothetical protein